MITITRSLARKIRTVFGRALGITARGIAPPILLTANSKGLVAKAALPFIAVEYHGTGRYRSEQLAIPFQLLKDCEGRHEERVQIEVSGDVRIAAKWQDAGIPIERQYEAPDADSATKRFPGPAAELAENPATLLDALRDAMQTTDQVATRYALNCIQLCSDGRIVGTDGRQLLVQSGFNFPWYDNVLVQSTTAFACKDLHTGDPVHVGRSKKWIVVRTGPWTLHLAIKKEGRYPSVDGVIPSDETAQTRVVVSDSDAGFLASAIRRLPRDDQLHKPITVDVNGQVIVRSRSAEQQQATEIVLRNSSSKGHDLRFNTNRTFLGRALALGFRQIEVSGVESPLCCRDTGRSYIWLPLAHKDVLKPGKDATRIESPVDKATAGPSRPSIPKTTRRPSMSRNSTNGQSRRNGSAPATTAGDTGVDNLIQRAESLKVSLRDTLKQTGDLVTSLKGHRKQTKAVRSTLASLRQLQAIDA